MSVSQFNDRLVYKGNLLVLIKKAVDDFALGEYTSHSVIEVGFEDYNVKLVTSVGQYLVKIFSKNRDLKEIERYVTIIEKAIEAGVRHPEVVRNRNGQILYHDAETGLYLVTMNFIQGKTFYDEKSIPSDEELKLITSEAVKINSIDYKPPYLFDSWAIPNMQLMFNKTKDHLTLEGLRLVKKAFEHYNSIPLDNLPRCLVHGDLIKTNIIKGDDGEIYVIDFAVANTYPRIQELAVMAANLLFDESGKDKSSLRNRADRVINAYLSAGGTLTQLEIDNVFNYALPGAAMEYMGSVNERVSGDNSSEIEYWEKLGLEGLREALNNG